jgi:hypothetical protein
MPHQESPESPVSGETEQSAVTDNGHSKTDNLLLDRQRESDVDKEDESLVDEKLKPPSPKRRWPLVLGVAILVIASGGLGWYWWQSSQP